MQLRTANQRANVVSISKCFWFHGSMLNWTVYKLKQCLCASAFTSSGVELLGVGWSAAVAVKKGLPSQNETTLVWTD